MAAEDCMGQSQTRAGVRVGRCYLTETNVAFSSCVTVCRGGGKLRGHSATPASTASGAIFPLPVVVRTPCGTRRRYLRQAAADLFGEVDIVRRGNGRTPNFALAEFDRALRGLAEAAGLDELRISRTYSWPSAQGAGPGSRCRMTSPDARRTVQCPRRARAAPNDVGVWWYRRAKSS